jgi:hypothetical protein
LRVEQLGELFEAAERFLQATQVRRRHVGRVAAGHFTRGRHAGADVVRRVAGRQTIGQRHRREGSGQFVPELFAEPHELRVIQHEANIIFNDAQRFAGAIRRGVDDAQCCDVRGSGAVAADIHPRLLNFARVRNDCSRRLISDFRQWDWAEVDGERRAVAAVACGLVAFDGRRVEPLFAKPMSHVVVGQRQPQQHMLRRPLKRAMRFVEMGTRGPQTGFNTGRQAAVLQRGRVLVAVNQLRIPAADGLRVETVLHQQFGGVTLLLVQQS